MFSGDVHECVKGIRYYFITKEFAAGAPARPRCRLEVPYATWFNI